MCSINEGHAGGARPLGELERELCELAAHIAAATCRWLLLLAEWDARAGWAEWGVNSCAEWLGWRCSIGPGTAREHVRVARQLTALPLVREAFGAGELSYSKVRAITRVAGPETEEALVELARHATGAQLERVVRGYRGALAVSAGMVEAAYEDRYVRWHWDEHGSLLLRARIPADEGALLITAIEAAGIADAATTAAGVAPEATVAAGAATEATIAAGVADAATTVVGVSLAEDAERGSDRRLTAEQRDADALVAVARAAMQNALVSRDGGDPCELIVHVDVESLSGDAVHSRSEIDRGPTLVPETVRRLGCDAAVVRIVEQDGQPLTVGRRTRTIPPALRRALRSRDAGCRFPGCSHRRFLHAHHIQHWALGGTTDLSNLVHLCSHHHRLVHEGGYVVRPAAGAPARFYRPDGTLIPDVCPGGRAHGSGIVQQNRARGITINADTCTALSAGDSIDYGLAVEGLLWRPPEPAGSHPDLARSSPIAPSPEPPRPIAATRLELAAGDNDATELDAEWKRDGVSEVCLN